MKFKSNIELQSGLKDSSGALGTSGQVLSTTGSTTSWITLTTGGTVSSVAQSHAGNAFSVTGSPITNSGTLTISMVGNASQYINGAGNLTTFPTIPTNNSQLTNGAGYITSYTNTTYTAGSGLALTGTVFSNTAPNVVQTTVSGNAGTATKLLTARTIAGVLFDGTANISLNNNAIINGAGYTTNTGTTTASNTQTFTNKSGNISQWTNNSGYITSYSETDTLATVVARGNTTGGAITVNGTLNVSSTSTLSKTYIEHLGTNWNETIQGTGQGSLHFDPAAATDHIGNAITFGASDSGSGSTAFAGIYTRSDGSYGTKMYLSTTDSYGAGSKTAIKIEQNGQVSITRSNLIVAGDITVTGGDITLGGTGRIQGVDTVSAATDAANKAYVDAAVAPIGSYLPLAGGTMTGKLINPRISINRINGGGGYNYYSETINVWQTYMSPPGAGNGYNQNMTAPSGTYVDSWALRSVIEPVAGYGWTWEEAASTNDTTPTVVAELSSNTGTFRTKGIVYSDVSVRAPRFYDSNNTAYYVDPAATSNFNTIVASGGNSNQWNSAYDDIIQTLAVTGTTTKTLTATRRDGGTVTASWSDANAGGTVTSIATTNGITGGTITSTGTLQVDSTVVRTTGAQNVAGAKTFTSVVKGDYFVGTNYATDGYTVYKGYDNWNHYIVSRGHTRPGHTKTQAAILGGHQTSFVEYCESNSTTGFFFIGSAGSTYEEIGKVTKAFTSFVGSVRSPIFYDSDNTSYYTNPASTSNINGLTAVSGLFKSAGTNTKLRAVNSSVYLNDSYSWTNSAFQTTSIEIIDATTDNASVCATLNLHNYGDGGVKIRMGNTGDKTLYFSSGQSNGAGNPTDDNTGTYFNALKINSNIAYHAGNLTLATLGYTGATNANYITNNNQLTNGAGYITSGGTTAGNVIAFGTSSGNIDSDFGQCFKTFDPIPSGTPPIQSPNLRTINVGNDFGRRTQIAFNYSTDQTWFRRRDSSSWQTWREYIHSGNISTQTVANATNALPLAGGVMTGKVKRNASNVGFLEGSYNNVGANHTKTNPIYTIGSNYNPADTTLGSMYGIGFTSANASFVSFTGASDWGMYVAASGVARVWLDGSTGNVSAKGSMFSPAYYDYDNTAYYVNPASISNLNVVKMQYASTQNSLSVGSLTDVSGSSGNTTGSITFSGFSADSRNNYSIQTRMENYGGNYNKLDLSFHTGIRLGAHPSYGGVRFYSDQTMTTEIASIGKSGNYITAVNSVRAPIFYDTNNTSYYTDPASTSNMNSINLAGPLRMYAGAYEGSILFGSSASWRTGIRQHDDGDAELRIWASNSNGRIFLATGYNGEPASIVKPTDGLNVTSNNVGIGNFSTVDPAHKLHVIGTGYATNDFRSPIFYDSNNTGYYTNPASTSNMNVVTANTFNGALNGNATSASNSQLFYGLNSSQFLRSDTADTISSTLTMGTQKALVANDYGRGVYGVYSASRLQHMWSMGTAYNLADNGTSAGNLYGMAWSHPNAGGVAANLNNHGQLLLLNGGFQAAISGSIRCVTDMRTPIYYDSNNTGYYLNPAGGSYLSSIVTVGTVEVGTGSTGNIYCGAASSTHFRFHTVSNSTYFDMNSGNINWRQSASTRFIFYATTANMTVYGTVTQYSDERHKENIVEIGNCIDKIKSIRGVYYNRTDLNTETTKIGVIAQEVEVLMPELVLEEPETGFKSVAYSELTAVLVNGMKEQQAIIEDLKARLEILENK